MTVEKPERKNPSHSGCFIARELDLKVPVQTKVFPNPEEEGVSLHDID
jgi:hypothetical protein